MAKTKLICAGLAQLIAADRYFHITGRPSTTAITTEVNTQITFNQSGVISNFSTNVGSNTSTACNFYVRQNAGNSSVTIAYTSGQTGIKEDITNTLSVSAGDEINYFADITSGTSISISVMACTFESDTDTYQIFASTQTPVAQNDNLTRYFGFNDLSAQTTETNSQCEMLTDGTFQHFFVNVTANTNTTASTTFDLRVGASSTGCPSVVYLAGQTGIKEDTSTTKSVVDGDLCNFRCVIGSNAGTTTTTFSTISCGFYTTNQKYQESQLSAGLGVNFNQTIYQPIHGAIQSGSTSEPSRELTLRNGNTDVTELLVEVSANTIATSPSTIDYRVNRGGNTLQVSFNAAQTGTKSTTGTTSVVDGDEVDYRIITPNTSGTLTIQQISTLNEPTPPPGDPAVDIPCKMLMIGVGA